MAYELLPCGLLLHDGNWDDHPESEQEWYANRAKVRGYSTPAPKMTKEDQESLIDKLFPDEDSS